MKTAIHTGIASAAVVVLGCAILMMPEAAGADDEEVRKAGVQVANVNAYYSGGNTIGGSHPTAASWSFTVPEGDKRLLLVITPAKADPSLNGKKSAKGRTISQRAFWQSLSYAGKELTCLTQFDEVTYDNRHVVFWTLVNPPVGTANFEGIQHRRDNGGESWLSAYALTGVDQKSPVDKPLRIIAERNKVYPVKCKAGGMVVCETVVIKLLTPDPSQTVRYANDKSCTGTTAVGSPEVKLSWSWAKKFKRLDGIYRAAPHSASVVAIAVNPHEAFGQSPAAVVEPYALEPIKPDTLIKNEKPGLEVTLFDLSANPAVGGKPGSSYRRARLGWKIPKGFETQTVLCKRIAKNVDHKYDFGHHAALNYDKGFMNSGIKSNFVAQYKGIISLPESGRYVFELNSNDQSQFYLGEELIINNQGNNSFTMKIASLNLKRGRYRIRVLYVEEDWKNAAKPIPHGIRLGWRPPSGYLEDMPIQQWRLEKGVNPIPPSAFTHDKKE